MDFFVADRCWKIVKECESPLHCSRLWRTWTDSIYPSRVIYFNDLLEQTDGKISVADMGSRKFDPDYIRQMLCDGLSPEEGWIYLRGMGEVKKNHFKLYPSEWDGTFGVSAEESQGDRIRRMFHSGNEGIGRGVAYGWTVGLDLPTKETIEEAIEMLRAESAG